MAEIPVFADAGVGQLVIPILGGLGVAGGFLAAAVITGGIWLVHGSAAPRARRWFLSIVAVMSFGAAAMVAWLAKTVSEYWGVIALALVGALAIVALRRPAVSQPLPTDLDDPMA